MFRGTCTYPMANGIMCLDTPSAPRESRMRGQLLRMMRKTPCPFWDMTNTPGLSPCQLLMVLHTLPKHAGLVFPTH